jgi:putative hydrolase of the HAD superfamily
VERIRAVCLDIDGTLLDDEAASRRGLKALVGNDAAFPVWRRTSEEHYARFLAGEVDFDVMRRERTRAFFAAFGEELSGTEATEREQRRMAAVRRSWQLFNDTPACLDWLRSRGLRLAVITNAPGVHQRHKLASVGLAHLFDSIVISEELGVPKPDARIFQAACAKLDVRPEEVVHVGDRLDLDAVAAMRAGMHGVWLNRRGEDDAPPHGIATITGLGELPGLIEPDAGKPAGRSWVPTARTPSRYEFTG